MAEHDPQSSSYRRRATIALIAGVVLLLATCLLWFTSVEAEAFLALEIGGIALASGCGVAAALFSRKGGRPRLAAIAVAAVIGLILGSILIVLLLIEFASRFE